MNANAVEGGVPVDRLPRMPLALGIRVLLLCASAFLFYSAVGYTLHPDCEIQAGDYSTLIVLGGGALVCIGISSAIALIGLLLRRRWAAWVAACTDAVLICLVVGAPRDSPPTRWVPACPLSG